MKSILLPLAFFAAALCASAQDAPKKLVLSVPFEGAVAKPKVHIVSRALDEAKKMGAAAVVINMNTPGGDLGSTLKLMELLGDFEGKAIVYVNDEAVSAGSYIAIAADSIWFAPRGVMGAAEAVSATGANIDESMQRKINSFMTAKVKAFSGAQKWRAQVQRAMMDPNFELKIGDDVLKEKGELLSLTADEAVKEYDGARLLADGIAKDEDDLLRQLFGEGGYVLKHFDLAAFEKISEFMQTISPLLIGIGVVLIALEFKLAMSGVLAIAGLSVLLLVFLGTNLAGLSGYEEVALFITGVALIALDLLLLGGLVFPSLLGVILMIAGLAMALSGQLQTPQMESLSDMDFSAISDALARISLGLILAGLLFYVMAKLLPRFGLWRRLVPKSVMESVSEIRVENELLGKRGWARTDLDPSGKIEIGEKIYEAATPLDSIPEGSQVEVVGKKDFYYLVKKSD